MCFVAARQSHGGYGDEEEHADRVLDSIFHVDGLCLDVHKPCQPITGCRTAGFAADMSKNVDISPRKCYQSGILRCFSGAIFAG